MPRLLGVLLALASGGALVASAVGVVQLSSRPAQGLVLGFLAGVFGALCFWLGAAAAEETSRASSPVPDELKRPAVSPEDAKRWLQKFLEQQQQATGERKG